MVVTYKRNWPRILRQVGGPLSIVVLMSIVTTSLNYVDHPFKSIAVPDVTLSLLGAALGILLGFRTNSAYDRWWEARKLWGLLVNSSRSLARQAVSFTQTGASPNAAAVARELVYCQIAFTHALRCALRKQQPWDDIEALFDAATLEQLRKERNIPAAILQRMGILSAQAASGGVINEWRLQRLDATFTDLSNIQGGCERIKNTPLPRQYDFYPELFVKVYCFILPLVLVSELELWTPVATAIVSFVLLVLNRIGKNLEDPFENTVYDTPMTTLSRTIEINLRQALGEEQLPSDMTPEEGILF